MATSSARYCYHFNGTGNTVALTDMTQAIVNSYAYEPFGTVINQQEAIPQPFKFVGQYGVMAEPNGLYYMRARYYDPSVGRFISEDPIGFGGGDANLYAYARNNPVNLVDPFGLCPGDKQACIDRFLRTYYGDFVANTLVPQQFPLMNEDRVRSLSRAVFAGIGCPRSVKSLQLDSLSSSIQRERCPKPEKDGKSDPALPF